MPEGLHTDWETPDHLVRWASAKFGPFDLDPACTRKTAKAPHYYTPTEDGLAQPWFGIVWCNPPYGRELWRWVAKAVEERPNVKRVVMLLPVRSDTGWWHDLVLPHFRIHFLRGRVRFIREGRAQYNTPFPSALAIMEGAKVVETGGNDAAR